MDGDQKGAANLGDADKHKPSPYEMAGGIEQPAREPASAVDQTVYLPLPRRSLDEWRANGLVRARPNLAQLVTLVREAYEAALGVTGMRSEFDWLSGDRRDAGAQPGWNSFRERIDRLRLAASEWESDPAIAPALRDFIDAKGDGVEKLTAAVELLEEACDADDEARLDDLVRQLKRQLYTLQTRSATVGEACHGASLRTTELLSRALDEVMRAVPPDERELEPQSFQRDLSLTDKALAVPEPAADEALDRNPRMSTTDHDQGASANDQLE